MALRNIRSRSWLIPVFVVLLLWGCGYDEGDDHTRVQVSEMPNVVVTLTTTVEEDEDGGAEYTFVIADNELALSLHNYPRLGDVDLIGGGLSARVTQIDMTTTDADGNDWSPQLPFYNVATMAPDGDASVILDPFLPMDVLNEIVSEYFTDADICDIYFTDFDRLVLSEFTVNLVFHIEEFTNEEVTERYTIVQNASARLTHDGDIVYSLGLIPAFCTAP